MANLQPGPNVCVVGSGALGLLAIKNLTEQGLNVTAFERYERIGGVWNMSQGPEQTSALRGTKFNTSKQVACFSDFPMPEEYPSHPSGPQVEQYLISYANHFDLMRHIQFSTLVDHIERDEVAAKWFVFTKDVKTGEETRRSFDRVVVASGMLNVKNEVRLKGIEKFAGDAVHSREFKDPSKYEGKNVLVVGIGATGADTTSFLVKAGANRVIVSHRAQYYLLPRMFQGNAFDHGLTRRALTILRALSDYMPGMCMSLMSKALISVRKKAFPWLNDHPSFSSDRKIDGIIHRVPMFSDDLADNLRDGKVEAVTGIQEITGPKSVTLTDETVLEDIDAIIICSGYTYDMSIVRGKGDPTDPAAAPDHYEKIKKTKFYDPEDPFPRLYRGVLSEQYPDSLAILGHFLIMSPPFMVYDLTTMAIASVWSGSYAIEPLEERRKDIDSHYDFVCWAMNNGPVPHSGIRVASRDTYDWLNRVAGTGLTERVACFSAEAWKFWWNDRKLYNLVMDGTNLPAVYRLFDTGRGRKPWPGARETIIKVNEEVKAMGAAWKKEQQEKKTK